MTPAVAGHPRRTARSKAQARRAVVALIRSPKPQALARGLDRTAKRWSAPFPVSAPAARATVARTGRRFQAAEVLACPGLPEPLRERKRRLAPPGRSGWSLLRDSSMY